MTATHQHTPFPSLTVRRTMVYVSGPMTTGMVTANIRKGCEYGSLLLRKGYAVSLPHVNILWEMIDPQDYGTWLSHDFEHIRHVDCILRIPGESHGGDREVEWAAMIGKPVYFDVESLQLHEQPHRLVDLYYPPLREVSL